ncbi:type II secretion system protein [Alteromonas oceanisediminis]|uniref:type II secretion system protein n=1 Tax=Alteromonas oceanisediminis TaxID=2836180 RepID=UPI001BD9463B|nr:hypothetical protein [Alteromonas oceanisediminis]MBT0585047.1 hypothetical protein [Alteromonas oceanisediminis]
MIDMRPSRISCYSGFSLLEAIVALLLVTMLSMASFSWISNLLLSVGKLEENAYTNQIKRNVSEFISDVNVMTQPDGNRSLGGIDISWTANLIEPIQEGINLRGDKTPFEVGLYRVSVNVEDMSGERVRFEFIQVGYRALSDDVF